MVVVVVLVGLQHLRCVGWAGGVVAAVQGATCSISSATFQHCLLPSPTMSAINHRPCRHHSLLPQPLGTIGCHPLLLPPTAIVNDTIATHRHYQPAATTYCHTSIHL